jgi:hypothetical protein
MPVELLILDGENSQLLRLGDPFRRGPDAALGIELVDEVGVLVVHLGDQIRFDSFQRFEGGQMPGEIQHDRGAADQAYHREEPDREEPEAYAATVGGFTEVLLYVAQPFGKEGSDGSDRIHGHSRIR